MHGRSLNAENGRRSALIVSGRLEFICGPERMSHRMWVARCKTLSPEFAQAAITSSATVVVFSVWQVTALGAWHDAPYEDGDVEHGRSGWGGADRLPPGAEL